MVFTVLIYAIYYFGQPRFLLQIYNICNQRGAGWSIFISSVKTVI
jgi:hypothetical protein